MVRLDISARIRGGGRTGRLYTPHGEVETPAFMPVGTYGTVRGLTAAQIEACGSQIVLANAYHLALRPGAETISKLGGLHRFMGWPRPILTDSGGYQLFSLSDQVKINETGAVFRSHYDGSPFELTPERAAEIQRLLGVDIGMVFDALTGQPDDRDAAAAAADRTVRWARRTCEHVDVNDQTAMFAIVQGGLFEDLRASNAAALLELDYPGYAIGGLSVGEDPERTMETAQRSVGLLPDDKPRYMMGMGTPEDLVALAGWGYDMFDCVMPTRNARNGTLFTRSGRISIRNSRHREDPSPIDDRCSCYACENHSRGYLHHLAKRGEMLAATLGSIHNVSFYQDLMRDIRGALVEDRYEQMSKDFLGEFRSGEKELED
jgi:queuine tRNA-ribosyltransferase